MSLIRKIVIVLVGVSLALLVTVLLLSPDSIRSLAVNIGDTSALIRLPLAILIDVIMLALIIVLVRNERGQQPMGGLTVKAQGAHADVNIESARERILRAVRAVPDVVSAQAEVKAVRGRADVDLDVLVSRESLSIPDKQKEIDRALRQVINKQLGLQMAGKPRVHIRMDDEPSLAVPVAAPVIVSPIAEPAKVEPEPVKEADEPVSAPVQETEPKPEEPVAYPGTMNLRNDPDEDAKPESSDSTVSR